MCVAGGPAGEEFFADIGFVIAVGVFEEEGVWGLVDDDAAVGEGEASGDGEFFGEDDGFVGAAIVVGIFEDADAVAAFAFFFDVIGVVDGFGDPESAAVVPCHTDRFTDEGFGGEELDLEAGG